MLQQLLLEELVKFWLLFYLLLPGLKLLKALDHVLQVVHCELLRPELEDPLGQKVQLHVHTRNNLYLGLGFGRLVFDCVIVVVKPFDARCLFRNTEAVLSTKLFVVVDSLAEKQQRVVELQPVVPRGVEVKLSVGNHGRRDPSIPDLLIPGESPALLGLFAHGHVEVHQVYLADEREELLKIKSHC